MKVYFLEEDCMAANWLSLEFSGVQAVGKLWNEEQLVQEFRIVAVGEANDEMMLSVAAQIRSQNIFPLLGILISSTEASRLKRGVVNFGFGLYDITTDLMEELNIPVVVRENGYPVKSVRDVFAYAVSKTSTELYAYGYNSGKSNQAQETLFTVGNGYISVRGNISEFQKNDNHDPATYIAGMYSANNTLLRLPNWTLMKFAIDGEIIHVTDDMIQEINRTLDFKSGMLTIELLVKDAKGRLTKTLTKRVVSLSHKCIAAQSYTVIPQNYSGMVNVASVIDGDIKHNEHPELIHHDLQSDGVEGSMFVRTAQTQANLFVPFKHNVVTPEVQVITQKTDKTIATIFTKHLSENQALTIEKIVGFVTDKKQLSELQEEGRNVIRAAGTLSHIVESNTRTWSEAWSEVDIKIKGDILSQKIMRVYMYHALLLTFQGDSVPADVYQGTGLREEMFSVPFYNTHFPQVSRRMLMQRSYQLDAARYRATKHGGSGALFTKFNSDEIKYEEQLVVTLDLAFVIWHYVHVTNDKDFMIQYGAEILFEIARFWSSKLQLDARTNRYAIDTSTSPSENTLREHTWDTSLMIMVSWLFEKTREIGVEMGNTFPLFAKKMNLSEAEYQRWQEMKTKLNIPRDVQGTLKGLEFALYPLENNAVTQTLQQLGEVFKDEDMKQYVKQTLNDDSAEIPPIDALLNTKLANMIGDTTLSWESYKAALKSDYKAISSGMATEFVHRDIMSGTLDVVLSSFAGISTQKEILEIHPQLPIYWDQIQCKVIFKNIEYFFIIGQQKITVAASGVATLNIKGKMYQVGASTQVIQY